MRRVAGVGWLLLVGCNRIFGITATQPWDASADVVADMPHVVLTWQLATTSSNGKPSAMLEYPPFAPATAPAIRTATIDGPFVAADYSSDPATPGWILVPRSYFEPPSGASGPPAPWRLEYTLPGDVPHEVQWAPDDKIGHLVVPMAGRIDRQAVPTGSGYDITLNNFAFSAAAHTASLFTTGLWTAGLTEAPSGSMIHYDFPDAAVSLNGPRGGPDDAHGDRAVVLESMRNPDANGVLCTAAIGSATLASVALTTIGPTPESIPWDTKRTKVMSEVPDITVLGRLTTGLGKLNTMFSGQDSLLLFGSVPSISFPGLIGTSAGFPTPTDKSPKPRLPVPVMLTLLQCPVGPLSSGPMSSDQIPDTAQPSTLSAFPTVVHVQLVEARSVMAPSVTLYSGIEAVVAADAGGAFKLAFPAAMPTRMTLTTPDGGMLDLVDNTDQIAIGAPAGAFILDFVPESGTGLRADYHDVLLHQITATGMLTTERIYTVTAPRVRIDGSVLKAGSDYVFEIRSYKGHVMAPRGDFAPIDYPYGGAVVFTRTFKTS